MGLILPITQEQLVGRLRRELSYQYGMECATRTARLQRVAREAAQDKTVQRKCVRHLATIPAREFFRIQQEVDPDFFRDRKNIVRLIQDNPELKGGVGTAFK